MVKQSSRGKYSLSEIGQTSMTLFQKVEREQERTHKIVHNEIERYLERYFWKVFFLSSLIIVNLSIPLTVDITVSVHTIYESIPLWQLAGLHLAGFSGMTLGLVLFVFYDRQYYSKNLKTNLVQATVFAVSISLVTLFVFNSAYNFTQATLAMAGTAGNIENQWIMGILRTVAYLATAPLVAYAFDKLAKRR